MATKLFKIGERAYYGKWRLTIKNDKVICTGSEYYDNVVMETKEFKVEPGLYRNLILYLESVSTYGWACSMMEWVESHLPKGALDA
jgi:hypothetical protein